MGANTGNRGQISAARQQQAMEGRAMRRRDMEQQAQLVPAQEQGVASEMPSPVSQTPVGFAPERGRMPRMRSGINFGPGRANRIPEQNSPEYQQLLQRIRDRSLVR